MDNFFHGEQQEFKKATAEEEELVEPADVLFDRKIADQKFKLMRTLRNEINFWINFYRFLVVLVIVVTVVCVDHIYTLEISLTANMFTTILDVYSAI